VDDTDKNFGPDLPLLFKMDEIWSLDSQENYYNCCHQMSDFKAKMHQIQFRLGRPLGELTAPPDLLAGFYGPTSKGKGRRKEGGSEGDERGRRGEGGKWEGRDQMDFSLPKVNFLVTSLLMFSFIDNEIEAVGAYIK